MLSSLILLLLGLLRLFFFDFLKELAEAAAESIIRQWGKAKEKVREHRRRKK